MKKLFFIVCITTFLVKSSLAQVSAPGMGELEFGNWYAIGMRQDITKDLESMTYVGQGLKSIDGSKMLALKPYIFVINQEFYRELSNHWKVSLAGSYRHQKDDILNIDQESSYEIQQEFRIYGRISYVSKIGKAKLTQTARQEVRRFVDQNWSNTDSPIELRSRLKSQIAFPLDNQGIHKLTAGAELLFSTKRNNISKVWSGLAFKETRLTMFYTYRMKEVPVALSLGYMNNMIKSQNYKSNHYLSLDVVIENPFGMKGK